jgi:hypothetical protein
MVEGRKEVEWLKKPCGKVQNYVNDVIKEKRERG